MYTNSLEISAWNLHSSFGSVYVLDENKIQDFRNFWNAHKEILMQNILNYKRFKEDKFKNIKTCVDRFNSAHSKTTGEDKFVDYVISLEALFSTKDDPRDG